LHLLDRLLAGRFAKGQLTIVGADGQQRVFGDGDPMWPQATLRIHDPRAERRILLNPRLGLGEAFIDGSVSVDDDDIMALIELVRRNNPWEKGGTIGSQSRLRKFFGGLLRPLRQMNGLARSRSNVAHHYDLSNDFYRLWLDTDMQYSCAWWPDATAEPGDRAHSSMSLEAAQAAKKAHIAAKLYLAPGQRILDIGCGWGGMAIYLAKQADVTVHGITLSQEQLNLAQERAADAGVADRVTFELVDYRNLARREPGGFDRIVSVGMFEHVGVPQFPTFFRACANLLRDDGVMLLHTIGRMGAAGSTDAFTRKYIFPGGYIPALSEIVTASEPVKLIASDVELLRMHYAMTLREWDKRVAAQREAIVSMFDERFFRMWRFYLAGATATFENGGMGNYQIQFIRQRRAVPLTRDYMSNAEAALVRVGQTDKHS
jgi:cyclopropane-fatty-acyl-phospholipid synthase